MRVQIHLQIQREPEAIDLPLPAYRSAGAAGLDLHAAVAAPLRLASGERVAVPTGIRVAIPDGYEGQVRPRSGLARHQGITLVNAPGTVDSDFRGEIEVLLINLGQNEAEIRRGDRIAQLVVAPVMQVVWEEAAPDGLPTTLRGKSGFGSSGNAID